jgi:hypothetical protein
MIGILRKNQQTLMIVITILVIICFVWLYDPTLQQPGPVIDRIGEAYGKPVTFTDQQRAARKLQVCAELGLMELINSLITAGGTRDELIR